jgi:hypothetical protein
VRSASPPLAWRPDPASGDHWPIFQRGRNSQAFRPFSFRAFQRSLRRAAMNGLIYLIGLIVVIMFILSFLGLR